MDFLINNAGVGGQGFFHERPLDDDMRLMALNMVTPTLLCKLFLKEFVARGSGRILNVSSTAAMLPGPLQATYYASKAYLTSLGDAVWQELQGSGVTMTTLMPGGMDTGFARASGLEGTKLARSMPFAPRVVAEDGYNAMMRGDMEVISKLTTLQMILPRLSRCLPKRLVMRQVFEMQKNSVSERR